jgi:hypothetical protein
MTHYTPSLSLIVMSVAIVVVSLLSSATNSDAQSPSNSASSTAQQDACTNGRTASYCFLGGGSASRTDHQIVQEMKLTFGQALAILEKLNDTISIPGYGFLLKKETNIAIDMANENNTVQKNVINSTATFDQDKMEKDLETAFCQNQKLNACSQ